MGSGKLAYCVKATFPGYGDKPLYMIVYHAGPKADLEHALKADGWTVLRIRGASMDDIAGVSESAEVLDHVHQTLKHRTEAAAAEALNAEIARQRQAEEARRASSEREKKAAESHDLALFKAAGDLLSLDLEREMRGNAQVASICAKALMFFDQANVNRKDIFTSISLDFASFQGQTRCPVTNKVLNAVLHSLNEFLTIDAGIVDMGQALSAERVSVEGQINSIASRTYTYGGSDLGFLFSAMEASSAVKRDEKAIRSLQTEHGQTVRRVQAKVEMGRMRQSLQEFRVKTAVSILLVAAGKSDTIEVNMPLGVERFVLHENL